MNSENRLYSPESERRQKRSLKAKRIATRGEALARDFLEAKGYITLACNFRAGRSGEIDIVAMDQEGIVCFVEVKTRSIDGLVYGIPEIGFEAVGYRKQRRILIASQRFMAQPEYALSRWRYDVIVVGLPRQSSEEIEITHVPDAFS